MMMIMMMKGSLEFPLTGLRPNMYRIPYRIYFKVPSLLLNQGSGQRAGKGRKDGILVSAAPAGPVQWCPPRAGARFWAKLVVG